jgi:hypothetical protein
MKVPNIQSLVDQVSVVGEQLIDEGKSVGSTINCGEVLGEHILFNLQLSIVGK